MIRAACWTLVTTILTSAVPVAGQIRPEVVGGGVISTGGGYEFALSLSPDGREAWFTRCGPSFDRDCAIFRTRRTGPWRWSEPEVAPFSGVWEDLDPFVSPDGERIYFMSDRPLEGEVRKDFDLWYVTRTGQGWSAPVPVGPPVATPGLEGFPAVTADGTLYFFSNRESTRGRSDVWRARPSGEGWDEPENLGPTINSPESDTNAYVAPDGSYLIFASRRDGGRGGFDLWYAARRGEGWDAPVNLGPAVNSERWDFTPAVSPDGTTLYFASPRFAGPHAPPDEPRDAAAHAARIGAPRNGIASLYAVDLVAVLTSLGIESGSR